MVQIHERRTVAKGEMSLGEQPGELRERHVAGEGGAVGEVEEARAVLRFGKQQVACQEAQCRARPADSYHPVFPCILQRWAYRRVFHGAARGAVLCAAPGAEHALQLVYAGVGQHQLLFKLGLGVLVLVKRLYELRAPLGVLMHGLGDSKHPPEQEERKHRERGYQQAVSCGLMSGYDDGSNTFGPDDTLTRAQLAQMMYNEAGKPEIDASLVKRFSDCGSDAWYAKAVAWAAREGLMTGYDDGSGRFGPNDELTREQLAVVFWRIAGEPDERGDLAQFPDGSDTSSWALDAVGWAVATELLRGYDNTGELGPGDDLTRAQAAAVFMRQADAEKDEKTSD